MKNKYIFVVFILTALVSLPSSAISLKAPLTYFSNAKNISNYLDFDEAQCGGAVRKLLALVDQYGADAAHSNNQSSENDYLEISQLLSPQDIKKDLCAQPLRAAYFASSLLLLDAGRVLPEISGKLNSHTTNSIIVDERVHHPFSPYLEAVYLFLDLYRLNRVTFLTPSVRSFLGGEWEQTSPHYTDHKILGAYDCNLGQIYLDPKLRPFDAGSTLIHEFDHLFRDKYYYLADLNSDFPTWRAYVLADEEMASIQSAIIEGRLEDPTQAKRVYPSSYVIAPDLSLVNRTGSIQSIRRSGDRDDQFKVLSPFIEQFYSAATSPNFFNPVQSSSSTYSVAMVEQSLGQSLIQLLLGVYFPNVQLEDAESHALSFNRWNPGRGDAHLRMMIFANWLGSHMVMGSTLDDSYPEAVGGLFLSKSLSEIETLLKAPSQLCLKYQAAVDNGKMDHYLGIKTGGPIEGAGLRPEGSGLRPEGAGMRPTTSIHPCVPTGSGL